MTAPLDYLDHLARESARFGEVLRDVGPQVPVPTCPQWTAEDLLWHLAEVQWFWGTILRERLTGEAAQKRKPARPSGLEAVRGFFAEASGQLHQALAAVPAQTPAWTWSTDQTAGFIRRRQTHEALIHRLDAELVAGQRTPMDVALSADGVDEALRIMYGDTPPSWGRVVADPGSLLRIKSTDTGSSWLIMLGRFRGTAPEDGVTYDEPRLQIAAVDLDAEATIEGRAEDLDCLLWRRPTLQPVNRSGDVSVLAAFDATIAPGIS
jgi:uncharacterized protein (TIGR03083 family)